MKKLMIAAAIVCAAVASQAATFNWGTDGKAFSIKADTIMAGLELNQSYDSATSGNANTMANQISDDTIGASWAYTLTLSYGTDSEIWKGSLSSGDFSSRAINLTLADQNSFVENNKGNEVDYTIVLTGTVNDENEESYDITSNEITGKWKIQTTGDLAMSTAGAASWTVAPEPTSGLLLLLGIAGLALKRRRA